jgi:hypothetical protein
MLWGSDRPIGPTEKTLKFGSEIISSEFTNAHTLERSRASRECDAGCRVLRDDARAQKNRLRRERSLKRRIPRVRKSPPEKKRMDRARENDPWEPQARSTMALYEEVNLNSAVQRKAK